MAIPVDPSRYSDLSAPAFAKLRHLAAAAVEDYQSFCTRGDEAALRRLVVAVIAARAQEKGVGVTDWSDGLRLVDDIGFDSLAIAELVFFFEDLFGISITNAEIMRVRTLGELHVFVRRKVSAAPA